MPHDLESDKEFANGLTPSYDKTVCLVACSATKATEPAEAQHLYQSSLFSKSSQFAAQHSDRWFILSAKHGLLRPDDFIEPYELSLHMITPASRMAWGKRVMADLSTELEGTERIVFIAGNLYRQQLVPPLRELGHSIDEPTKHLGIGYALQWLGRALNATKVQHLTRLYKLLGRLAQQEGQGRPLDEFSGKDSLPKKGVYFFVDTSEKRRLNSSDCRIVRVGTHGVSKGSQSTLWQRLRTHRGSQDLSGNHRSSIFRLHVGAALLQKRSESHPSWGAGQSAPSEIRKTENDLERMTSEYIRSLQVYWLKIGDKSGPDSDRAYIERNCIALLSGSVGPIDIASPEWLGNASPAPSIRKSSLWNVNHVDDLYDPSFINIAEAYVTSTLANGNDDSTSIAPVGWRSSRQDGQLGFFDNAAASKDQ